MRKFTFILCLSTFTGAFGQQRYMPGEATNSPFVQEPVEIVDFVPVFDETTNTVTVNWATVVEDNTAEFVLEKSLDGITYKPIGKIKAAGISRVMKNYTFTDPRPDFSEPNYYRLKTVYNNLHSDLSEFRILIVREKDNYFNIYPNPVESMLHIDFFDEDASMCKIVILDETGKILIESDQEGVKGNNTLLVPVDQLKNGKYLFSFQNVRTGKGYLKTIVKR